MRTISDRLNESLQRWYSTAVQTLGYVALSASSVSTYLSKPSCLTKSRLLLLLIASFCFFDPCFAIESDDWHRGSGTELMIRIVGDLLLPVDKPSLTFNIEVTGETILAAKSVYEVTLKDKNFEFWLPVGQAPVHRLRIQAASTDGRWLGVLSLGSHEIRTAAKSGIQLSLEQASREILIEVIDGETPVPHANILARLRDGLLLRARSNKNGVATIYALPHSDPREFAAWTLDHRLGGYGFDRGPRRDPKLNRFQIELSNCRTEKLRFLDDEFEPIPKLSIAMHIATQAPDRNFIGSIDQFNVVTNEHGEVDFDWLPDWWFILLLSMS